MSSSTRFKTAARHVRARASLVIAAALLAIVGRAAVPAPPERTVKGVAAMLGRAAGGEVRPDEFIWEERGGVLHDALLGRRVLFLARTQAPADGAPADLFRARVRLSRAGRPIALNGLRNLTKTPLGDERELVARGSFVAFATSAFGAVQGVTVLDLRGDYADREAQTRLSRAAASLEGWLDTGTLRGLRRVEVAFGAPPAEIKLDMTEDALVMALGSEGTPAALDPSSGALNTGGANPFLARAQRIPRPARPLGKVAVEVVREGAGATAAAAVGAVVAALGGSVSKGRGDFTDSAGDAASGDRPRPPTEPVPSVFGWPPESIEPQVNPALPDEGVWAALRSPLLPPPRPPGVEGQEGGGDPPSSLPQPLFFATALRPDPGTPRAVVRLVAMDMRQLELRMEAGFDEPRPAAGPRGSGRLPEGNVAARVVAAFAGGRPAGAGEVGMVVDRRVLVPPTAGAMTVAVERDGRATLGRWPVGSELPEGPVSLRQSPLALVLGGAPVVSAGEAAAAHPGAGDRVERAALCVTREGHAVYAWSAELTAGALAKALALAGCEAGMHLGMAPSRSGFVFVRARGAPSARSAERAGWDVEPLTPSMSMPAAQLAGASPTELFYLVTRDPRPAAPTLPEARWTPDLGRQPPPSWLPGVFATTVTTLGAEVRIVAFSADRFAWRVRAGSRELAHREGGTFPGTLEPKEQESAGAAISLGTARRKGASSRGLVIAGSLGLPFRSESGALLVGEGGLSILRSGELPAEIRGDAVELPLTADEGKLLPAGRKVGGRRERSALCIQAGGAVLVATATFDSDEATTDVLLRAGCPRVVALDRGARRAAFVHRAGTDTPPLPRYEVSVLYAVEVPMRGRSRAPAAIQDRISP